MAQRCIVVGCRYRRRLLHVLLEDGGARGEARLLAPRRRDAIRRGQRREGNPPPPPPLPPLPVLLLHLSPTRAPLPPSGNGVSLPLTATRIFYTFPRDALPRLLLAVREPTQRTASFYHHVVRDSDDNGCATAGCLTSRCCGQRCEHFVSYLCIAA